MCVGYNRPRGLERLLSSLLTVDFRGRNDVDLIISLDYGGGDEILSLAEGFSWPHGKKRVRTFQEPQRLKKHMLQCFAFAEEYDCVAVLEDDLYVGESMFGYLDECMKKYDNDEKIAGFALYSPQKNWLNFMLQIAPLHQSDSDVFFARLGQSWGEAMTTKQWHRFREWLNQNPVFVKDEQVPAFLHTWPESSWLKFWDRYCILNDRYLVYPYVSLTTNFSDVGTHNARGAVSDHQVPLERTKTTYSMADFSSEHAVVYDEYWNLLRPNLASVLGVDELMVDLYATKRLTNMPRSVLTTRLLKHQVIRSFALCLRPIEENILRDIQGEGVYLYDTTVSAKRPKGKEGFALSLYSLRTHDAKQITRFSWRLFWNEAARKCRSAMHKLFKR